MMVTGVIKCKLFDYGYLITAAELTVGWVVQRVGSGHDFYLAGRVENVRFGV